MSETTIVSFVVRFIQEEGSASPAERSWRGVARHVQSGQEIGFTRLDEALAFMNRYVNLADSLPGTTGERVNDGGSG